ncbi:FG-GAP-like repeat-containing protein [Streptomyces sp. NPDC057557]|uniref:FG-GAP-like repeat-containing protein n=1 Tax=Streptomyces sp. NPDC057557 TaxID=3346167 RepID=UPI003691FFF1
MRRHTVVRSAVAVVAAIGIGAGFVPLAAGPASAAAGGEVVFPATVAAQPRTVIPLSAGPTGYLRYEEGRGQYWSTYSGEDRIIYNDSEGPDADGTYGAGADVVAAFESRGDFYPGQIRLYDVAAGSNSYLELPAGHQYVGTYGTTVVTYSRTSPTAAPDWHLLRLVNGAVQDTKVVGWPEGAERPVKAVTGGADGVLVQYGQGGHFRPLWISLATGEARPVGPESSAESGSTVLTRDHVVEWTKDGKATFYAKNSTSPSGPLPVSQVRDLPYAEGDKLLGVTGEQLVVARASGQGGSAPYRLVTVPLGGGPETVLFAYGRADAMPTPDGGLLVVAGSALDGLGVQLIRPGDGGPTAGKLTDVTPATSRPRRLSFSQGTLESLEVMPDQRNAFRSRTVSVTGPLAAGSTGPAGDRGLDLAKCTDVEGCPDIFATGDGRTVIQPAPNGGGDQMPWLVGQGSTGATLLSVPGLVSFQVQDVSGRYAMGLGRRTDGTDTGTAIIDLDTRTMLAKIATSFEDSDLYGDQVWGAGAKNGTVVGYDVRTGVVKQTLDLGTGCRAEGVKVTSHWLSWNCAGAPARGGVFDLAKRTNLTHTDPISVLGDGYVAWRSGPDVKITDVRGATPVVVGTYRMVGDGEREEQYAVDTGTGRIAYQQADGNIAVADLGIPASPLARIDSDVPASTSVKGGVPSWSARWWLSKPAASWQVTFKSKVTGATVRTVAGGEARGLVKAVWDGKDAAGRLVGNGAYTWTFSAKPADGQGAALTLSGSVKLTGGAAVRRDFVGSDGFGDLLAFTSAGVADFRGGTGNGTGGVSSKVSGSGWTGANTVTSAVPFDDVNGDRCNDVLVRVKSGDLRAYKPACGGALKSTTAYTRVGGGWNVYDALTSPGDLTGDGRADLLARETSTGYLYLYVSKGAGVFKARVKIGTGWKGYLLAGAGDLNGDGKGDLLARDKAGVLWRYAGTGKGTLASRVKVGGGWQIYNSLVGVGDASGDGKADLLARDTSGVLWAYRGDGKGLFVTRVKVGTGWQMYSRLS